MSQSSNVGAINPLAAELNSSLEKAAPEVLSMLSAFGRRLYFPKGILTQSAEAKAKAHRFNATIGIATEGKGPMYLPSIQSRLNGIDPKDAYPYAPPAGRQGLREQWRKKLLEENPSLAGKTISLPIVASAITHSISVAGDLFVDQGDVVLMPDQLWGNYRLAYEVQRGAKIVTFPFYAGEGFNCEGFAAALTEHSLSDDGKRREKLVVVLNFPNNPTGYMPTVEEGDAIVNALHATAQAGTKVVALCDDAYFGLFYHLGGRSMTESLFGKLAGLHPNLMAVKLDGATKELFVWGLRCGFVTFGPGRADTAQAVNDALDAKVRGSIRAGISNSPMLSQTLVEQALSSPEIAAERAQKRSVLEARARRVYEVANSEKYQGSWTVYPFNSGYFMLIKVNGVDANTLRVHLLDQHGVGLISTAPTDLRVAFSSLEVDDVQPLFDIVHQAIGELRAAAK